MVFKTTGVCAQSIIAEVDKNHKITKVEFIGGCSGNTRGITSLVTGMQAEDVISSLAGTRCGNRPSSCPDQLTLALKAAIAEIDA